MTLSLFVVSLTLTLLFEVPFAWGWGLRSRHNMAVAVLVNVLTNPIVVLLNAIGVPVLLLETGAMAAEAFCYRACGEDVRCPFLLSVCANLFSYSMGLVLRAIF